MKSAKKSANRFVLAYFGNRDQAWEAFQLLDGGSYAAFLVEPGADSAAPPQLYRKRDPRLFLAGLLGLAVFLGSLFWGLGFWFAAAGLACVMAAAAIYFVQNATLANAIRQRYGRTILSGETLVAVEVAPDRFQSITRKLRSSDPPAIFVVSDIENLKNHNDPVKGQGLQLAPEELQQLTDVRTAAADAEMPSMPVRASRSKVIANILAESESTLDQSIEELNIGLRLEHSVSPAAEWLLDNAHLVRSQVAEVRRGLTPPFLENMPGSRSDQVRVQELASALVINTDGVINQENVLAVLAAADRVKHLNIGEIWAFPQFLRLVLVDRLHLLSLRVVRSQHQQELAYFFADRIIAASRRGSAQVEEFLDLYFTRMGCDLRSFGLLAKQLQDEDQSLSKVQAWLHAKHNYSLADDLPEFHKREALDRISISNIVVSLRKLSSIDFIEIFEAVNQVEALLKQDPTGTYAASNFATRDQYRMAIEELARQSEYFTELQVAEKALELARAHPPREVAGEVGYYLIDSGRPILEACTGSRPRLRDRILRGLRRRPTIFYLSALSTLTALLLIAAFSAAVSMGGMNSIFVLLSFALLLLLPLSEIATQLMQALVVKWMPVNRLPRLSLEYGIPDEFATLVAVPMMMQSERVIDRELLKLEIRYLANRDANLFFALLGDFVDADTHVKEEDSLLLDYARQAIERLNTRHKTDRFVFFYRERKWSKTEGKWIGWERKRGKLEELNAYLLGRSLPHHSIQILGRIAKKIQFVITLDADTLLPVSTGRALIETIAHPLNRLKVGERQLAQRGYTIIQPRVSIGLPEALATRFTRLFSDISGSDPYARPVSDAYQDLFSHGIFHGKAIYDVEAFHHLTMGRFPEDHILSHDLIEGEHVRVGLASDIEIFESFPPDYPAFCKRQHRWIRGDWQIAPWIRSMVPDATGQMVHNPLTPISRWKIFDNLRRSLVAPAATLLVASTWVFGAGVGISVAVIGGYLTVPFLLGLLAQVSSGVTGDHGNWQRLLTELKRILITLILLPHQALISVDAILRACYRMTTSRKHMLEWETAEATQADPALHLNRSMAQGALVTGTAMTLLIFVLLTQRALWILPILILWLLTTETIRALGQQDEPSAEHQISKVDQSYLRLIARSTWRFFDDLVGPGDNWLPPDNYQEYPNAQLAHRTSPTNIGLWITSLFTASDLGHLTPDTLLNRLAATLKTMKSLEKYRGHLLNWYDTETLAPLLPRYVSTADSGNLLASLLVAVAGVKRLMQAPIAGAESLRALEDHLRIVQELSAGDTMALASLKALARLVRGGLASREYTTYWKLVDSPIGQLLESTRWSVSPNDQRGYWIAKLHTQAEDWHNQCTRYLRWRDLLVAPPDDFVAQLGANAVALRKEVADTSPSLNEIAAGSDALRQLIALRTQEVVSAPRQAWLWLEEVEAEYNRAHDAAMKTIQLARHCTDSLEQLIEQTDLSALYDPQKKLMKIGLAIDMPVQSDNHYDLLASEARLASFIGIAKGDLPAEHWVALGRPYTSSADGQVLLSWSGTMFEYLMPALFMRNVDNSLLDNACRQAVRKQIEFGEKAGVPWGLSESGHSAVDANQTYQYYAFGIPGLSLKARVEQEVVVSPYSSVLALQIDAPEALANLKDLQSRGMFGRMGFFEAIDFTREKGRGLGAGVVVQSYMAHHQGMSLMAIDNVLHRGIMQRRFHADPRIRAVETLLYERIPAEKSRLVLPEPEQPAVRVMVDAAEPTHRVTREDTSIPRAHLLANGRMALMVTNAGSGYCHWNDFDVTRWSADTTLDAMGTYCYIRKVRTGETFSATYQPTRTDDESYSAVFSADRVEFSRRDDDLEVLTEVTVSAEDDAEIRRYMLTNRTLRELTIDLTTYTELAMAPHAADRTHPAFSKMFVTTEVLKDRRALIASRRTRSDEDPPLFAACVLAGLGPDVDVEYETDRASFLGRDGTTSAPAAVSRPLNGKTGIVLDPIFAQRCRIVLKPRSRVIISSVLVVASSRDLLLRLIDKYKVLDAATRAFELAWTHAQLELRYLGIQSDAAHRFQELASHLLYPNARIRAPKDRMERTTGGQSGLWKYGISGDLPIAVITIADIQGLGNLRELLTAHNFWRMRGLKVDLIILNQESPSYDRPLAERIRTLVSAQSILTGMDQPGGVFVRAWAELQQEELDLILSAARIVIRAGGGLLIQQLGKALEPSGQRAVAPVFSRAAKLDTPGLGFEELAYFNSRGGFSADGKEYTIFLKDGEHTPLPWINVMANRNFGTFVSEAGFGTCWSRNSQMNRLTPWNNDPVSGPLSDILYIRDEDSGEVWTVTPQPIRDEEHYRIRHGHGYTVYEHNCKGIEHRLEVFVPSENTELPSARIAKLRLRNGSGIARKLTVNWYVEWVLGTNREEMQSHIVSFWDESSEVLMARNSFRAMDPQNVSYMMSDQSPASYSGDRGSFLGRNGSTENPAGLRRKRLDRVVGSGLDPCGALQIEITLDPGQSQDLTVALGEASSVDEVRKVAQILRDPQRVEQCNRLTREFWNQHLGAVQVKTPVASVNYMINGWLLYQVTSCRLWGRTALYQSGGAFGFRDQLQDVMALCIAAPQMARNQILLSASRQFVEGDVQHWWHAQSGAGVRTRCSDDFLWLVQATCHYVQTTGDFSILDEQVSFLDGRQLREDELEIYYTPEVSVETASLEEHCQRALDHSRSRGPHGLPLIGTGDWNDALNHVGAKGKGESVWLGWFLIDSLKRFADLQEQRGNPDAASAGRATAAVLAANLNENAWDGQWYLRAFFDTGETIGSHLNEEARIDSIAQSWSVISGEGLPERQRIAMHAVYQYLVLEKERLVLLFDPPFDHSEPHPGYIMGYPPGLRENGGQYTHASLWVAMAAARLGDGDNAVRLMQLLNPVESTRTESLVKVYKGEPYSVAADVYHAKGLEGRSGWTWYTGSASWTYRVWVEEILGLKILGEHCAIRPVIPATWPGFTMSFRHGAANYTVEVMRGTIGCHLDGRPVDGSSIPLEKTGEHRIEVWLPEMKQSTPEVGELLSVDREQLTV
ncbi:GH36-type glycosyl hydrolase domain-containing protein [Bryobacter aggregatus]|uniref:GH36-type glycosyl hydrolase domain-containing protein n=1 Tax=Bryobacter aggregatus TaxID=360054 RepID=UPI000A72D2D4|nr:glucoamylase family protein [Bryobacter aggregatus]